MINTIIFDIGGVLIGYDWNAYLINEFNDDELLIAELKKVLLGDYWCETFRRNLSDEETIDLFLEKAPHFKNEILSF